MTMFGKHSFPTALTLFFWGVLCVCIQYATVEKFWVFPSGKSHVTWGNFSGAIEERITFDAFDGVLLFLFLSCSAFLLYIEVRQRVISKFLQGCFTSESKTLGLLSVSLLLCVRYYFSRGEVNWAADASSHIATAWLAAMDVADGHFPSWTFYMGAGSPYLQNYGFAFFYLVGAVDWIFRDLFLSLKLSMAAARVLSGIGMYYLVTSLCRSRRAGFIAGIGYVLCFWHTQHVLIMGRLPLSIFYATLPWAFFWVERIVSSPYKMRAALLGGVSVALLSFAHPGYGAYAMLLLICYFVVRLWSCWSRPDARKIVQASILFFFLSSVLGSYMNVGMYVERASTMMHDLDIRLSEISVPTWRHVLGWSNFRFWLIPPKPFHWYGGYLGLSLCVMAIAGVATAQWRRDRRFAPCWLCLILTAIVVFTYRLPPISLVPLIQVFNASRYLLFLAFFLALSAGLGTFLLLRYVPRSRSRWYTLFMAVMWIDLFPTTFIYAYSLDEHEPPTGWPSEIFEPMAKAARPFLERGELPNYRAQWIGEGVYPTLRKACMLTLGKTPIAEAFHPGELRTLETFTKPFIAWAHKVLPRVKSFTEFDNHPHYDLLITGFYLLNTRYLIVSSDQPKSGFTLELVHSPFIVSGRLEGYDESDVDMAPVADLEGDPSMAQALWILLRTEPHQPLGSLSCERILVRNLEEGLNLGTKPTARLIYHGVDRQQVKMNVEVSATCYARLAYAYSPYLHLSVNGRPVQPMKTAGRFLALPLEAGAHEIVIKSKLSPLRRSLLTLGAISLIGALVLVFREHRKNRADL